MINSDGSRVDPTQLYLGGIRFGTYFGKRLTCIQKAIDGPYTPPKGPSQARPSICFPAFQLILKRFNGLKCLQRAFTYI